MFGQTKHCLAPCTGEPDAVRAHDSLLLCLLRWLAGEPWELLSPPQAFATDPERAAIALRSRLSEQGRFEEAGDLQRAIEHLAATRRACTATHEALGINWRGVACGGAGEDAAPSICGKAGCVQAARDAGNRATRTGRGTQGS